MATASTFPVPGASCLLLDLGRAFGRRGLTVLAHLLQVVSHGQTCFFRIAPFYGGEDSLVMNLAPLRAPGNAEDAQALLAQDSDDRIEQGKNQWIGRTLGQGKMKIKVGF